MIYNEEIKEIIKKKSSKKELLFRVGLTAICRKGNLNSELDNQDDFFFFDNN